MPPKTSFRKCCGGAVEVVETIPVVYADENIEAKLEAGSSAGPSCQTPTKQIADLIGGGVGLEATTLPMMSRSVATDSKQLQQLPSTDSGKIRTLRHYAACRTRPHSAMSPHLPLVAQCCGKASTGNRSSCGTQTFEPRSASTGKW